MFWSSGLWWSFVMVVVWSLVVLFGGLSWCFFDVIWCFFVLLIHFDVFGCITKHQIGVLCYIKKHHVTSTWPPTSIKMYQKNITKHHHIWSDLITFDPKSIRFDQVDQNHPIQNNRKHLKNHFEMWWSFCSTMVPSNRITLHHQELRFTINWELRLTTTNM